MFGIKNVSRFLTYLLMNAGLLEIKLAGMGATPLLAVSIVLPVLLFQINHVFNGKVTGATELGKELHFVVMVISIKVVVHKVLLIFCQFAGGTGLATAKTKMRESGSIIFHVTLSE